MFERCRMETFLLRKIFLCDVSKILLPRRFFIPLKKFFFDWKLSFFRLSENNFSFWVEGTFSWVGVTFCLSEINFSFEWKQLFKWLEAPFPLSQGKFSLEWKQFFILIINRFFSEWNFIFSGNQFFLLNEGWLWKPKFFAVGNKFLFFFFFFEWMCYSRNGIGLNHSNCEENVKRGIEHRYVRFKFRSGPLL